MGPTRVIAVLALGGSACADRVPQVAGSAQTSGSGASATTTSADATSTEDSTSDGSTTTTSTGGPADSTTGGALACAEAEDAEEYIASLMQWEQARDDASNSYWFIGERRTGMAGIGPLYACTYRTLIVVEAGQVVERTMFDGEPTTDEVECERGWAETGTDVGTHDARTEEAPVPPWNLDEVYASCCEQVLSMEDESASFYPLDDGLFHRCFWSSSSKSTHAPPGWGDEIRIAEIGFGEQ